ncbi:MAG: hypothetical protein FWC51_03590, partial [Proteobacteria bacterium]|nr:hypothetical protein [Pseudomonadota bacterium]
MKKVGVFAMLAVAFGGSAFAATNTYPIYNGYVPGGNVGMGPAQYQMPNMQGAQYIPQNTVGYGANGRITGGLPPVGSNVAAARQYYDQPDATADDNVGGVYIGLGAGFSMVTMGGMTADYAGQNYSYLVPGAFKTANYKKNSVMPLEVVVGGDINSQFRIDLSYTRYNGLSYPDKVETADGNGGFIPVTAAGGAITGNAAMINLYYNLDSFTGAIGGGSIRPYIGVGVGIAMNTISDYVVYDGNFYYAPGFASGSASPGFDPNNPVAVSDIYAYHAGGTTENIAYKVEGGVTTKLSDGILVDLFVRYSGLGKVQSSGNITLSQTDY